MFVINSLNINNELYLNKWTETAVTVTTVLSSFQISAGKYS